MSLSGDVKEDSFCHSHNSMGRRQIAVTRVPGFSNRSPHTDTGTERRHGPGGLARIRPHVTSGEQPCPCSKEHHRRTREKFSGISITDFFIPLRLRTTLECAPCIDKPLSAVTRYQTWIPGYAWIFASVMRKPVSHPHPRQTNARQGQPT